VAARAPEISSIPSISSISCYDSTMSLAAQEPITLPKGKMQEVQKLERLLKRGALSLVSDSGESIELPAAIYKVLKRIVELMAEGKAVTLVPDNQVVTTQRAADILGMSRPFFIKLLETGVMAHHRIGNQRRVYLRDVLQFAHKRDKEREAALNRLSRHAFETGLYEKNRFPEGGQDE
jgi:excisionase family DNA binding protein